MTILTHVGLGPFRMSAATPTNHTPSLYCWDSYSPRKIPILTGYFSFASSYQDNIALLILLLEVSSSYYHI